MDVTPTTPQPRPSRAKSSAVKTAAAPPKPTKSGRRKVTAAEAEIVTARLLEVPADVNQRIATTAYFLAAARNFEPGHELEDWLEAERQIRGAD